MIFCKVRPFFTGSRIVFMRFKATKLSKNEDVIDDTAAKIKKLHYENKVLFGKVEKAVKEKSKAKKVSLPRETLEQKNDLSSEIYWLTQYQPVLDFQKKSKTPKSKKMLETKADPDDKIIKKRVVKKLLKRNFVQPEIEIPESHLQDLPKPININIKSSLDKNFESKIDTLFELRPIQGIPFSSQHLKAMINFPLTLGNNKSNKAFLSFKEDQDKVIFTSEIPSVSKILKATMPNRSALIQWKALKIAELGLDGFNLLQKCKC